MGASLSVKLTQTGVNESSRTGAVNVVVTITSTAGTHNHYGSSTLGQGSLLYVTIDGNTYSSYITFGSEETGTFTSTVYSNTVTVPYSSSGTKTVSASARCITATSAGTISNSASLSLTPISADGSSGGGGDDGDDDGGEDPNPGGPGGDSTSITLNCEVLSSPIFDIYAGEAVAIRFKTPDFSGKSTWFGARITTTSSYVFYDAPVSVAICSSDANLAKYFGADGSVSDIYQIAKATTTMSMYKHNVVEIQTDGLRGNTDYYLILWNPGASISVSNVLIGVSYTDDDSDDGGTEYRYLWIKYEEEITVTLYKYDVSGDAYIDVSDDSTDGWNDSGLWHVFTMRSGDYFRFNLEALPGYTLGEIITSGVQYNENRLDWSFDPNLTGHAYVTATVTNDNAGGDETEITSAIGVFYIDNNSVLEEYELFFDNGTGWERIGGTPSTQRNSGTFNTDDSGNAVIDCGFRPDILYITRGEYLGDNLQSVCIAFAEAGLDTLESCLLNDTMVVRCIASRTETGVQLDMSYYSSGWWAFICDDDSLSYTAVKYA